MTSTPVRVLLWILMLGLIPSARADIEFVGILATSQATHFALSDTETGTTDWVSRGGTFAGYTVQSYDRSNETLTLKRNGSEVRVRLKDDAKIKSSRLELTGTISFGSSRKIEVERATLLFDQENVFPLEDGTTYRITPKRLDDGNIRYGISVERTLAENKSERLSAPSVIVLPGHRFALQIGELGFAFTPKTP